MVSFEVQATAEFLIQEVDLIEKSGREFRNLQQKVLHGSANTTCHFQSNNISMGIDRHDTLADDLSSHLSDSDQSDLESSDDVNFEGTHSDSGLMQWRDRFLLPAADALDVPTEGLKEQTNQWKLAMYQVMQNADLKVQKLEYEVLMLRRLYEDARLTIERYEHKIDALEQQRSPPARHKETEPADIPQPTELRMENHLNKLLASRNKAIDENVELKKQLLARCPECRRRSKQKETKDETSDVCILTTDAKPRAPSPAQRPNFQKTAFTLVQRMGGRQFSKPTSTEPPAEANNSKSVGQKQHAMRSEDQGTSPNGPPANSRVNENNRPTAPRAIAKPDRSSVFRRTKPTRGRGSAL